MFCCFCVGNDKIPFKLKKKVVLLLLLLTLSFFSQFSSQQNDLILPSLIFKSVNHVLFVLVFRSASSKHWFSRFWWTYFTSLCFPFLYFFFFFSFLFQFFCCWWWFRFITTATTWSRRRLTRTATTFVIFVFLRWLVLFVFSFICLFLFGESIFV